MICGNIFAKSEETTREGSTLWVARDADVYFFASVIESRADARSFGAARTEVPRAVLRALRVLETPE